MARPPASEQVQVNFRMPADLKARIEAAAEANSRTTTAELVAALEEKYPAPSGPDMTVSEMLDYITSAKTHMGLVARIDEMNNLFSGKGPKIRLHMTPDGDKMNIRLDISPDDPP